MESWETQARMASPGNAAQKKVDSHGKSQRLNLGDSQSALSRVELSKMCKCEGTATETTEIKKADDSQWTWK